MSMFKTFATATLVAFAVTSCGALASMTPVPEGAVSESEVDQVLLLAANGNALVRDSQRLLARAVLNKEEAAKYDDQIKAVQSDPQGDLKEKEAKLQAIQTELQAALVKADFSAAAQAMKKEADEKKRQNVGYALYNLAWAVFNDKVLADQITEIVKKPPNPRIAGKLDELRLSGKMIGNQVTDLGTIVSRSKELVTVVGVSAMPTSASDTPKQLDSL